MFPTSESSEAVKRGSPWPWKSTLLLILFIIIVKKCIQYSTDLVRCWVWVWGGPWCGTGLDKNLPQWANIPRNTETLILSLLDIRNCSGQLPVVTLYYRGVTSVSWITMTGVTLSHFLWPGPSDPIPWHLIQERFCTKKDIFILEMFLKILNMFGTFKWKINL